MLINSYQHGQDINDHYEYLNPKLKEIQSDKDADPKEDHLVNEASELIKNRRQVNNGNKIKEIIKNFNIDPVMLILGSKSNTEDKSNSSLSFDCEETIDTSSVKSTVPNIEESNNLVLVEELILNEEEHKVIDSHNPLKEKPSTHEYNLIENSNIIKIKDMQNKKDKGKVNEHEYTPSMAEVINKEELFSALLEDSYISEDCTLEEHTEEQTEELSREVQTSRDDQSSSKKLIESYNTPQFTMRSYKRNSMKSKTIECEIVETGNCSKLFGAVKSKKGKAIEFHYEDKDENFMTPNNNTTSLKKDSVEELNSIKEEQVNTQDNIISCIAATIEKSHEPINPSCESTLSTFPEISLLTNEYKNIKNKVTQSIPIMTDENNRYKESSRYNTKKNLKSLEPLDKGCKKKLKINTPRQINNDSIIRSMLVDTLSTKNREKTALFLESINAISGAEDKLDKKKRVRQKIEPEAKPEPINHAIKRFLKGIINNTESKKKYVN